MLRAIFGSPDKPQVPSTPPKDARGDPIVLTPMHFDRLFEEEELPPNHRRKIRTKGPRLDG